MTTLLLLLIFPLIWPFVAKAIWPHTLSLGELAANVLIGVAIVVAGYFAIVHHAVADVEILNGVVLAKDREEVSCEHSYSCRCSDQCSGTGSSRSCTQVCDTCYEHIHDVDWVLETDVGAVKISRVDRQGIKEPARFTQARLGDPVARPHAHVNYVKAAPDSLFNMATEVSLKARFEEALLSYPDAVFDYHYVNRVLTQGVELPEQAQWNQALAERLGRLGPKKEVNAIIVFSAERDPQYATALRAHWLGGKKNDVVVVVGAPSYPAIEWVRVFSWTDNELFKIELRDAIQALKTVEREAFLDVLEQHVERQFVRKRMADFAYLKHEIKPPAWLLALLALVAIGASMSASFYFSRTRNF